MKRHKQTDRAMANAYGVTPRTIRNWRADGAPLSDRRKMRSWLAARRQVPEGVSAAAATARRLAGAQDFAAACDLEEGVASALARLSQMEARSYALLQAALKRGDPLSIRQARQGWLSVSESLRRYDLAISESRRHSTELVPRSDAERFAGSFVRHLKLAFIAVSGRLATELEGLDRVSILEKVRSVLVDGTLTAFASTARLDSPSKVPDWLVKAAVSVLEESVPGAAEEIEKRAEWKTAYSAEEVRALGMELGKKIEAVVQRLHLKAQELAGLPVLVLEERLRQIEAEIMSALGDVAPE